LGGVDRQHPNAFAGCDEDSVANCGRDAEIAKREGQGERHIRLLAPLAFVSPRIIAAIVDGSAPADLTVTGLAKVLSYSWAEQERSISSCNNTPPGLRT
jgi:hypothetical protein